MFTKMNKTQKRIILTVLAVFVISGIIWMIFGGEIWTKTEVLVEIHDELFDSTYKEWRNKFILGLDYTLAFDGIVFVAGAFALFFTKNKG